VDDHGLRLAFFHGHQFDPLNRAYKSFSETGIWLGGWLERCGVPIVDLWDKRQSGSDLKGSGNSERFARQAVALGKEMGADVIVTGHTHKAQRMEIDSHLFMNSGTCVAGRRELLLLDTGSQIFRVVREPDFC
jgi:predicted phosphodiesterase